MPRRLPVLAFGTAIGLLTAVLLAGCAASQQSATNPGLPSSTTVAGPTDLRSVIYDQFPATYIEERVGLDGNGALDLTAAATAQSKDPKVGATILRQASFQRGYAREWGIEGQDRILVIRALLFGSAQKAAGYLSEHSFATSTAQGFTKFDTPFLSRGAGFSDKYTTANGARVAHILEFVQGPLYFHLELFGPDGQASAREVVAVAQSQSAKVSALGYS